MTNLLTPEKVRLIETVAAAYGIVIRELTLIPLGFAAASYRVESEEGLFFLKVWSEPDSDAPARKRRLQSLRLARALHNRAVLSEVSYPIGGTDGRLLGEINGKTFALSPFLEGTPLPKIWTDDIKAQWADALVRLHTATETLNDVLPEQERFDLAFVAELELCFQRLERLSFTARPSLQKAQGRLPDTRQEIEAQIVRLTELQAFVQRLPAPMVLCHTDMGSDNLLLNKQGKLCILDWDEARVAPPEHDLHEARWIDFDGILGLYQRYGGATPLFRRTVRILYSA